MNNLYPLKFKPILKSVVWGGEKIAPYKHIKTDLHNIGESWELSGVKGNESIVAEGELEGRSISSLVHEYKGRLIGEHVYANTKDEFPLLIKFIDAQADLSIQVHPNDELAAKRHNGSKGKTEMWYVVGTSENAHLLTGLKKQLTKEEYVKEVENNTITDCLTRFDVKEGDVFFLPAGRIHAICGGCFIAEIQQTSDITYRIYDYGRLGLDGKPRELHTELAKDAIDFKVYDNYKTSYTPQKDTINEVVDCKYFTTSVLDLDKKIEQDLSKIDSFLVIMCLDGEGELIDYEPITEEDSSKTKEIKISVRQGETILVPATSKKISFIPNKGMKLLTSRIR